MRELDTLHITPGVAGETPPGEGTDRFASIGASEPTARTDDTQQTAQARAINSRSASTQQLVGQGPEEQDLAFDHVNPRLAQYQSGKGAR